MSKRRGLVASLFPARWIQWVGPLLALGATAAFLGVIVLTSGIVDLAASKPHPEGWAGMLHFAFARSTARHAAPASDIPADLHSADNVAKGAAYYGMVCAHCHAGPGLGQNPVALAMRPRPQYLPRVIGEFSDGELFRIVKHGVKYSAMPAWPVQDRDDEVWSVVAFLRVLPTLSAARFRTLAYGSAAIASPDPAALAPAKFSRHGYAMPNDGEWPVAEQAYVAPSIGWDDFAMRGAVIAGCARCHGPDGTARGKGAIPNITLLDRGYFYTALNRFATGGRHSGYMLPVATQLTQGQMAVLARHYTVQPRANPAPTGTVTTLATGARIAERGLDAARKGACSNCHDITRAARKDFPALDGQNFAYLRARLQQFRREPVAPAPGANPMASIARAMSPTQIDAVAHYYARRPIASTKTFGQRPENGAL